MNLDALAFDVTATVDVPILHPKTGMPLRQNGTDREAYIRVVSLDSPEVEAVQKALINKRLQSRNRAKVTADELNAERAETLVAATKDWFLVDFQGNALDYPFNTANARAIYTDPRFSWIREQVSEALDNRATFLK